MLAMTPLLSAFLIFGCFDRLGSRYQACCSAARAGATTIYEDLRRVCLATSR